MNSLKTKLLIRFGSITAFLLVVFSLSFFYFLRDSINDTIKTNLRHQAMHIEQALPTKDFPENVVFAIFDPQGKTLYKTAAFSLKNIEKYIDGNSSFYVLENENSYERINVLYLYRSQSDIIAVYKKDIDNKVEDLVSTLLILDPILLILLIYLASKTIDRILVPVKNVISASRSISVNDFATTIEVPKEQDEIWELVDSFNEMRLRLQEGVASIERFNSDVSHELKTPLTVILGEIEVTLRRSRSREEYEQSMQTIHKEAKQMQKIVENMLLLTKYTKTNIEDSFEECALDTMLLENIQKFTVKADVKGIKIHVERMDNITLVANPTLLNLVFSNLIDNAIKYSNDGKNILISLYQDARIHFLIKDEGIGIPKEHLEKITERFYRVDESRNKKTEGFGLGLFIVKHALELHNAVLYINSQPDIGTQIEVIL